MKKKSIGTIAARTKGKLLPLLGTVQFALEQAVKRIAALEKQCNGLARLDKQKDIRANGIEMKVKRLEKRVYGKDSE